MGAYYVPGNVQYNWLSKTKCLARKRYGLQHLICNGNGSIVHYGNK